MTQTPASADAAAEPAATRPAPPSGGLVASLHPLVRYTLPPLAIISLAYSCYLLLLVVPATHDEMHFAHAAWLEQQGYAAFDDFIFHNSPLTHDALQAYALFDPQFGVEVLYWGRALVALALCFSAFYLLRIGRLIATPAVAWLALLLFATTTTVLYTHSLLIKTNFQIRPEVLAYPFILASLYYALLLLKKPREGEPAGLAPWIVALQSSLPAGIALCFTPRVIFFVAGVLLVLLVNCRRLPWRVWLSVATGAAVPVVYYLGVVGFHDSYYWIYQYSNLLYAEPEFSRFDWLRRNPGLPLLLMAVPCALALLFLGKNTMQKALGGITLVVFTNVIVEKYLNSGSWNVGVVFGALVTALAVRWLWKWNRPLPMAVALVIALLCLAFPLRREITHARLHAHREYQLRGQVEVYQQLCEALAGDATMHIQKYHPVAIDDGMYYFWTDRKFARQLVEEWPLELQAEDLFSSIESHPPAILAPEELHKMARYEEDRARIDAFIAANYRETEQGEFHYFIRNDRYDDLEPLLDSPELYIHMWPVTKP